MLFIRRWRVFVDSCWRSFVEKNVYTVESKPFGRNEERVFFRKLYSQTVLNCRARKFEAARSYRNAGKFPGDPKDGYPKKYPSNISQNILQSTHQRSSKPLNIRSLCPRYPWGPRKVPKKMNVVPWPTDWLTSLPHATNYLPTPVGSFLQTHSF